MNTAQQLPPEEYLTESLETVYQILGEHFSASGRNVSHRLQQVRDNFPSGLVRTLRHLEHLNKRILHDEEFELYNTEKVVKSCTWALHTVEEMAGLRDPAKRYESSSPSPCKGMSSEENNDVVPYSGENEPEESWADALRNAAEVMTLAAACVVCAGGIYWIYQSLS